MIVMKIGGSILTHKEDENCVAEERLTIAVRDLARAFQNLKSVAVHTTLVVVLGAGSFGHPIAHKFNLRQPVLVDDDDTDVRKFGALACASNIARLASIFCERLRELQVPAVPLHPISHSTKQSLVSAAFGLMEMGCVPLLHGDIVHFDPITGDPREVPALSVLSGDRIVNWFCQSSSRVVGALFVSSFAVHDRDPCNKNAHLVPFISAGSDSAVAASFEGKSSTDVTGSMQGKVVEAISIANNCRLPVIITPLDHFLVAFEHLLKGAEGKGPFTKILPIDH